MAEESQSHQDIAKVYTATRRFPQLIGRTSDGTRIWGGPYTYTQIFGGGGALIVLWKSLSLWSTGGALMDWALIVCLTAGIVFGLGKLPLGGRNPFSMLQGLGNAAVAGAPREVGGLPIRPSKPQAVYSPVRILTPLSPNAAAAIDPTAATAPVRSTSEATVVGATAPATPAVRTQPRPAPVAAPERERQLEPTEAVPVPTAPPLLVALEGEGQDRRTTSRQRTAAAQTSVQSLLTMAQQRKEA